MDTTPGQPELVVDVTCDTGEGPLWHPDEALLYWCDIPAGRLYTFDPATDEHELVFERETSIGGFTIERDGALLLFGEAGAVDRFDTTARTTERVVTPAPDRFHARFNDVIADPAGRVFAGVMPASDRGLPGQLVRLDTDGTFELVRAACDLPNGLGFTPDRDGLYFTDTCGRDPDGPGYMYRYAYDDATGTISDPEVFLAAADIPGLPDGMTVDSEGYVWSAFWNGNRVCRFSPAGELVRTVEFEPQKVSSLTFAGPEYDTAYVTTACRSGRDTEGAGAGGLFRVDLGVTGRPEFRSAIGC